MLKIHHIDCGSMCPHGRKLLKGEGNLLERTELCCHCLLLETRKGLVLVDTGFGQADIQHPYRRLGAHTKWLLAPRLLREETALAQIQALGFQANDVRHILVTHLDMDHAGGLADFPEAQVHIHRPEWLAAQQPSTWKEKVRYRPIQWQHHPLWCIHEETGESWKGFSMIQAIADSDDEILLVPLPGHSRGHSAIAVHSENGWLLHAGDAYFHHGEIATPAHCPPGLATFQKLMEFEGSSRLHNQARLRELARTDKDVKIFCAHDTMELNQYRSSQ